MAATLWSSKGCRTPLAPSCRPDQHYMLHIPKTSGSSFAHVIEERLIPQLKPCNSVQSLRVSSVPLQCAKPLDSLRARSPLGHLHCLINMRRSKDCNVWVSEGSVDGEVPRIAEATGRPVGLITMVRDPLSHVLSQYAHCQSPGGYGMAKHRYRNITFTHWLEDAMQHPRRAGSPFCGYDPRDMMTRHLAGGDLRRAIAIVDGALFVGVTAHFDASMCLLRSQLRGSRACECPAGKTAGPPSAPPGTGTRVGPGTSGPRVNKPEEVVLTGAARALLEQLTRRDAVVYARGLSRFYDGLVHFNLTCTLSGDLGR